ncbi:hypothetical protein [Luteibacter sp. E-22]|uniref:hypothetical protein n=1 Tax=Luteibacter sp. E-22 TaxID=3404050 RepID=UPI003CF0F62A
MDDLDRAEAIEALERQAALARHASRPRIVPDCENCGEVPAHVMASGTIWRFCADCAADHLAERKAA